MAAAQSQPAELLLWGLVLIGVALVGFVVIAYIKRVLNRPDEIAAGFTLRQLDQMHNSGQISDQEYDRAKARMLASVRAPQIEGDKPRSG